MAYIPQSDHEFSAWLERNPLGFVVNTDEPPCGYNRLHKACCPSLRSGSRKNFAGGSYRKTCSKDMRELPQMAPQLGGPLPACGMCRP